VWGRIRFSDARLKFCRRTAGCVGAHQDLRMRASSFADARLARCGWGRIRISGCAPQVLPARGWPGVGGGASEFPVRASSFAGAYNLRHLQ
jgi:hypothetical protein